ncbi:membrane protein [Paenibacillus montaniterrae]|uniref:Membrane protein n=1 Tax=Paenibacillus montaniterrae TaxID=429341 RepID=A0A919YSW2_9BACL|nr:ImmA/IrrE family metallo-endopeptidase [Paenibacillus montaniterrae]GIP17806.1 membrane protein [Paenibacillus montaniterrae]
MGYESLLIKAEQHGVNIYEIGLRSPAKGLIKNNIIAINKNISATEKTCVLAEELGHYFTSTGNILDQSSISNRKQEYRARAWSYETLISLERIVEVGQAGIEGRHAVAEYLGVTEEFLQNTIEHYQRKYGLHTFYREFLIYFEPLQVIRL